MSALTSLGNIDHEYFSSWPRNAIYLIKQSYVFSYGRDFCLLVYLMILSPPLGITDRIRKYLIS